MPALLFKEPGHIVDAELLSLLPLLPLGVLYRRLGDRRALHVLRADRVCQLDPESDGRCISAAETRATSAHAPARLIGLLVLDWGDPLR